MTAVDKPESTELVDAAVACADALAGTQRRVVDSYIPIRRSELVELLCADISLSSEDRDRFRSLVDRMQTLFHLEFRQQLERVKDAYAPFDPDRDTVSPGSLKSPNAEESLDTLFATFDWLLERGNFKKLSRAEIDAALAGCSDWGLNLTVDFNVFERLEIYARGDVTGSRFRRRLRRAFRTEEVTLPIYQRLVVIFRLRENQRFGRYIDTQDVFIKLFKEIPKMDLEMLLPGTRIRMSLIDQTKILLPTVSGLAITGWKIISGALVIAAVGFYNILALLGVLGGTLGYGVRSFYGYLRTRQKYQLSLTESLYYQNLDNNSGVLFRLLDEAEEQESREAALAYFFLWQHAPEGWTVAELDRALEAYLRQHVRRAIDFEIGDALAKLIRLQVIQHGVDGKLRARPIEESLHMLNARWNSQMPAAAANGQGESS